MTPIPLAYTDRNTRILITLFLTTMLAAIGVAELNVYDKVGRLRGGVAQRYGPEVPATDQAALPSENDVLVARMNTFGQLLDVTHSHVFELPLVLFVLAHFLMRCRVAEWFKLSNYLTSSLGTVLFLGAPWTVRYISVQTAVLLYVGAIAIGTTSTIMIFVPIWDMWRSEPERMNYRPAGF
jgi:hypothetical protein